MNVQNQTYRQMVNAAVNRRLRDAAEKEANQIVSMALRRNVPDASPVAVAPRKRIRDRGSLRHQFAPKGSWLAMAPSSKSPKIAVSGQLASAVAVAEQVLAAGPAERSTLAQLMVDGNKGWTKVTASSCISRLVAGGRLIVVQPPTG